MGKTLKTGSTARFKGRYGVGIKKRVLAVEKKQHNLAACPACGFSTTKRTAPGLFMCAKCGNEFTGGAYETQTLVGKTIGKMVSQKQFLAGVQELVQVKESTFSDIEREVEKSFVAGAVAQDEKKEKRARKRGKKGEDATDLVQPELPEVDAGEEPDEQETASDIDDAAS